MDPKEQTIKVPNLISSYSFRIKANDNGVAILKSELKNLTVICGKESTKIIEDKDFVTQIDMLSDEVLTYTFKKFESLNSQCEVMEYSIDGDGYYGVSI